MGKFYLERGFPFIMMLVLFSVCPQIPIFLRVSKFFLIPSCFCCVFLGFIITL